jgi:hypothetical protein
MKNKKRKNIENESCRKIPFGQKILQWLKRNFTATIIGLILSVIGIVLTILFGIKDCSGNSPIKVIEYNTPNTTTTDASLLGKNVLLDISLLNYQGVIKQMNEDETDIFKRSYPNFQYRDTIIDNIYTILPKNEYYNYYYDKHLILSPEPLENFPYYTIATHYCYLDVKFVNNSDVTLLLDKLLIDVSESTIDNTPYLYVYSMKGISKLFFVNDGHDTWTGFDFEFSLLNPNQSFDGQYQFKTYIPYFKDRYELDLVPYIASCGFNYEQLFKLLEIDNEQKGYRKEFIDEERQNFQDYRTLEICTHEIQSPFSVNWNEYAKPFHFEKGDGNSNKYDYNYWYGSGTIHAKLIGQVSFRGHPLKMKIVTDIPITSCGGAGDWLEISNTYDILLHNNDKNYQIEYPISLSLKPNEAERIALKFTAKTSSNHKLKVSLGNINGLDIKCNPISLSIFQPRTWQEVIDNGGFEN